jgi:LPXTG-motif cell wall-anchored protein
MDYNTADLASADNSDQVGDDGTTVETSEALPKTASNLPLLTLMALLLLAGSGLARLRSKQS